MENNINNTNTNLKYFEDTIKVSKIDFNKKEINNNTQITKDNIIESFDINKLKEKKQLKSIQKSNNQDITQELPINTNDNETTINIKTDLTNNKSKP